MEFQIVTGEDEKAVGALSELATAILREYYDPIVGVEQNSYMLEKFQSVPALQEQLDHGYRYYFAADGGRRLGFVGFYPRGDALYLSKFYLHRDARGRGYGREMLDFVCAAAREAGLSAVELNVNKHNDTIRIYERMGFRLLRSEKNDIGSGYYMDDYVYRLEL